MANKIQKPAIDRLNERSEQITEVLSKEPGWLIGSGTLIFSFFFILLITLSIIIKYPDTIIADVSIISSNPPINLVTKVGGKIQRIFKENKSLVKKGENILLIESAADFNDISQVKEIIQNVEQSLTNPSINININLTETLRLGDVQPFYADFYIAFSNYAFFAKTDEFKKKVSQIQGQISKYDQLIKEYLHKGSVLKKQLELEKEKLIADSTLAQEKLIAPLDMVNTRKSYLNQVLLNQDNQLLIRHNSISKAELHNNIENLQIEKIKLENQLHSAVNYSLKKLKAAIIQWENTYLIQAPMDGKINFFKYWKENQFVNNGEIVLVINSSSKNFFARASLRENGIGKVKPGNKVFIQLSAYPYEEFGKLSAEVKAISEVSLDSVFNIEISLLNGLITSSGKEILPRPELYGKAEIIVDDKSVFTKIFEKIANVRNY